ncbi:hypothetical protein [Oecophyllibacter saccharovorans]|uniref:Uncharacterized protein n=1 Tax=Oecophyllibacter saccharovorans TaxID=2558360 RepID=A0A506ULF9_9PROT|nr:hypothetical protein [Oecophyllibacter saccharovorans]QDH15348.1 hypothetical protein E3E11_05230 [Oecophyllibacter saccharovorans]TPW34181.1 hypothetical protein E3202_06585 [Oecophyllibacter saccharovorans]TPW36366.1 hypothetical protein E3203_00815 [Oecophyllibacter saccharovorans]
MKRKYFWLLGMCGAVLGSTAFSAMPARADGGCQGVALQDYTPPPKSALAPLKAGQLILDLSEGTGDPDGTPLAYEVPEGESYPASDFRLLNCHVVRHFKSSESDPGYTLVPNDALVGSMAEPRLPQTPSAQPSTSVLSGLWKDSDGFGNIQLPELIYTSGTNIIEIDGVFSSRRSINASVEANLDSGLFACNRDYPVTLKFGNGAVFTSRNATCVQTRMMVVGFEPSDRLGAAVEASLPVELVQDHTVLKLQAQGIAADIARFRWQIDPARNTAFFNKMLLPGKF